MTWKEAARLRGLIAWHVECQLVLSHADEGEIQAGGLDECASMARERMLAYIAELTAEKNPGGTGKRPAFVPKRKLPRTKRQPNLGKAKLAYALLQLGKAK